MKKNIFIFENTNSLHIEESLETLINLFVDNYNVKLILDAKAKKRVKNNKFIMKYIIHFNGFFDITSKIKQEDIVIYPTISTRNVLLLYVLSFFIDKNIYYIRNSNSWIKYSTHHAKLQCKLFSYSTTFLKKRLLKKSYQIFVANNNLKNYLQSNGVEKTINIVPYKIFDEKLYKKSIYQDKLNIVIPGAIDISKKNLPLIREATKFLSNELKTKLQIILLGKPSRDIDLEFCLNWKEEIGASLKYYTQFIPDDEFSTTLQDAHYILGVLEIEYEDKYNKEIYGQTKDTGIDAQAIAYGKPLIINKNFKEIDEIKSSTLKFDDSKELSDVFKSIVSDVDYDKIANLAKINSEKISLGNIVNKLEDI